MSPIDECDTRGGRARRARRAAAALTALAISALLSTAVLAPVHAEELPPAPSEEPAAPESPAPETPAPETPEPAPSTPPAEPEPTPEPEPTTPAPAPTPTPPPTTTPSPSPSPSPSPTPTPTTTPKPTRPPTTPSPRATPSPRFATPFTRSSSESERTAALATARIRLDAALAELDAARRFYEGTFETSRRAEAIAEELSEQLESARAEAEQASRAYLTAVRGGSAIAGLSDLDVVLRGGDDLLSGLGTVERLTTLASDLESLAERAEHLRAGVDELEQRTEAAYATFEAVPLAQAKADVARAERKVAAARATMARLATTASASAVQLVNLPSDSGQLSELGWSAPVAGRLTDGFGPRPNKPLPFVNDFHRGTDIGAACGAPIFAATDGVVVEAGRAGTYGNWILIDHGVGVTTGYAHIADGGIFVAAGQRVQAGQTIAAVGSTGASTGCHLHFEVRLGGTAIDAVPFLAARGVELR